MSRSERHLSITIDVRRQHYGWSAHLRNASRRYVVSARSPAAAVVRLALLVYFGERAATDPDWYEIASLVPQQHSWCCWSVQLVPAAGTQRIAYKPHPITV